MSFQSHFTFAWWGLLVQPTTADCRIMSVWCLGVMVPNIDHVQVDLSRIHPFFNANVPRNMVMFPFPCKNISQKVPFPSIPIDFKMQNPPLVPQPHTVRLQMVTSLQACDWADVLVYVVYNCFVELKGISGMLHILKYHVYVELCWCMYMLFFLIYLHLGPEHFDRNSIFFEHSFSNHWFSRAFAVRFRSVLLKLFSVVWWKDWFGLICLRIHTTMVGFSNLHPRTRHPRCLQLVSIY